MPYAPRYVVSGMEHVAMCAGLWNYRELACQVQSLASRTRAREQVVKYVRPTCEAPGCDRGADVFQDDKAMCARHLTIECACGRPMPEAYAADGLACDTCDIESFESMEAC